MLPGMEIPVGYSQVNLIYNATNWRENPEVVFGLQNIPDDDPVDIANALTDPWIDNLTPVTSEQLSLYKIRVKNGPIDTGPFIEVSVGEPGTIASQALPNQACVLMRKNTALGGKKHRGRSFWPGGCENQTDGAGLLTDAALLAWQGAVEDFYIAVSAAGYQPVLLHTLGTDTPTPITTVIVQQLLATQRRRLRKTPRRLAA